MNEEVQLYTFENKDIRTLTIDDKPWFVSKDVATVLGYSNTRDAIGKHVDGEDKNTVAIRDGITRGNPNKTIINESGLYSLIISSKLPSAKKFKHWVTNEVLPSIRKHGAYLTSDKIDEILSNPDTIIHLATQLKQEREKLKQERERRLIAEQKVGEYKPKASYYDLILQNNSLVTITQIAKDYGMSGATMNQKLHELGVIFKQGKNWFLYADYQNNGWTHSKTRLIHTAYGEKAVMNTMWTQKGRIGIYQILKEHGILPLIEKDDIEN